MKIGIDARMYGPAFSGGGLGRYVEQLIVQLQDVDQTNDYTLFLKQENASVCHISNPRFTKEIIDIHWYTMKEQLLLGRAIDRQQLDIVHFPHWNVPLFLKTPFVVTIHDLILLEQPFSAKVTTRNPLLYAGKYLAYKRVLRHAVTASEHVIAVSNYTKNAILRHFPQVDEGKISVVYEGVTRFSDTQDVPIPEPLQNTPYFLYVGSAYPHKNLESLLHAFSFFHRQHPDVHLVFAGRQDVFYDRLRKELDEIDVPNDVVHFIMNPSDARLHALYDHATLYLFPSKSEGFGLPPLEAMQHGVPVAAARSTSLPEILGDAAMYFSPDDIEEMVQVMSTALSDQSIRDALTKKGHERIQKYAWKTMAEDILTIYESLER